MSKLLVWDAELADEFILKGTDLQTAIKFKAKNIDNVNAVLFTVKVENSVSASLFLISRLKTEVKSIEKTIDISPGEEFYSINLLLRLKKTPVNPVSVRITVTGKNASGETDESSKPITCK